MYKPRIIMARVRYMNELFLCNQKKATKVLMVSQKLNAVKVLRVFNA